jgi:hypothetical protein
MNDDDYRRNAAAAAAMALDQRDHLRLANVELPGRGWAVVLVIDGYYGEEVDAQHVLEGFVKETGIPKPSPLRKR